MFLYIRMCVIMAINFYSTRILLQNLGLSDYGIFNVVGGIISLLSFVTSSMTGSIQRFITFEIGKSNKGNVKSVIGTSFLIQILFSLLLILLAETIGLWFLTAKMKIPEIQQIGAFWVFQASIVTTVISIINVPYMALIIAKERMRVFAYISIIEASLKLLIVFAIIWFPFNRLVVYAFLLVLIQWVISSFYRFYCKKRFIESRVKVEWNVGLIKEMGVFAGWSTFGSLASVLFTQGTNILLNVFFGPIVNAARGVAVQVQAAIHQFCISFQTAVNPQITKFIAKEEYSYLDKLICSSSKFSFYMLYVISLPVLLYTNEILSIWLEETPNYSPVFVRIMICITWLNAISNPLITSAMATGIIRMYQLCVGGMLLLIVPVSYLCLKFGAPPYSVFVVHLLLELFVHVLRLLFLKKLINFNVQNYIKQVWIPIMKVLSISLVLPIGLRFFFVNNLLLLIPLIIMWLLLIIFIFGLSRSERVFLKSKFLNIQRMFFLL